MESPTTRLIYDIWGYSTSSMYAVGEYGLILCFDGGEWKRANSGTSENLMTVWGNWRGEVYAAGSKGTILRYGK